VNRREGEREKGRWREGEREKGRRGDGETERRRDGETERRRDSDRGTEILVENALMILSQGVFLLTFLENQNTNCR
jgi:hypothetical protein